MSISPPPPRKRIRPSDTEEQVALQDGELSIYSWNVNGIDAFLQTTLQEYWGSSKSSEGRNNAPAPPLRQFLRRHGWPTLCFLQEVKVRRGDDTKMRAVQRVVSNAGDSTSPNYEAHFCLPSHARFRKAAGRFYGVCALIRQEFAQGLGCIREVGWDDEGRILVIETRATAHTPKLAIFNVYLVNGTELPYRDPVNGKVIGTRHDRKLEVHKLLQAECRSLEEQGYGIIIAGDINVARSPLDAFPRLRVNPYQHVLNRADFEYRFLGGVAPNGAGAEESKSLDLLDTFRFLNPGQRGYSYFSRATSFGASCDRVDMILVSRSLIFACNAAGMHQTLAERASSDHVPIFAIFNFRKQQSPD